MREKSGSSLASKKALGAVPNSGQARLQCWQPDADRLPIVAYAMGARPFQRGPQTSYNLRHSSTISWRNQR